MPRRPLQGIPRWAERLAATVIIAAVGAFGYSQMQKVDRLDRQVAELREPRIGVELRTVADAHRRGPDGGEPAAVSLPPREHPYLLTLALYEARSFPDYRLEIVPAGEPEAEPLWARSGLERRPDDTFSLLLPGDYLPPGRYELRLYGVGEDGKTPLGTYPIEV